MKNIAAMLLTFLVLLAPAAEAEESPFESNIFLGGTGVSTTSSVRSVRTPAPALPVSRPAGLSSLPRQTLSQVFDSLTGGRAPHLCRVRHIWENDDAWYSRWKMVSAAKKTIDCTYYILDKDIFGQAFLGLLIRKAREGVKIRLMVDGRVARMGVMKDMPDRLQELAAFPGVQVKFYNPVGQSLLHAFTDFRGLFASNHEKIIVTDGTLCITGGRNIGPDYFASYGEYPIVYRDSDIILEGAGPAIRMTRIFEAEWGSLRNSVIRPDRFNFDNQLDRLEISTMVMEQWIGGKGLIDPARTSWNEKRKALLVELNGEITKFRKICSYAKHRMFDNTGEKRVKILEKMSHLGNRNEITPALVAFFGAARQEIVIQNPYLVLTREAREALRTASRRGVKIVIHSNSAASTDNLFPQAFLSTDWQQMLADMPTCRLFVAPSQKERLHAKTFVIDSRITIIGSYNMDPLSQDSNSELVAVVDDREFGQETREQIEKDMTVVIEYKIRIGPDGKPVRVFGPEDHLDEKTLKKIDYIRRLNWLRPVV